MATFDFTVPIYGFDQWVGADTTSTVSYPVGTTFSLNSDAALTVIDVQDDDGNPVGSPDNEFSDGFIDTPGDGSTPSTANNDQVLTQPVTINGQSFGVGDQVELEFAFTTTTGETFWVIRINNINVGISGPSLPVPGTTYEVASSGDGEFTPVSDVPCFVDGALIQTPNGMVPIENLKAGDVVTTLDHGVQPIKWTGARRVSPLDMLFFPDLRPIKLCAYALGVHGPAEPLFLSPNHRVMVPSTALEVYFAELEMLAAAKHLVNGTTISVTRPKAAFCYRHVMLENHEILLVNGVPCESLYPGGQGTFGERLLEADLFGEGHAAHSSLVRPVLRKYEAQLLILE